MDRLITSVLRGAAITLYIVGLISGGLMLYALTASTIDAMDGGVISESSLLVAIAWTILPIGLGFALDRLSKIGTDT